MKLSRLLPTLFAALVPVLMSAAHAAPLRIGVTPGALADSVEVAAAEAEFAGEAMAPERRGVTARMVVGVECGEALEGGAAKVLRSTERQWSCRRSSRAGLGADLRVLRTTSARLGYEAG